MVTLFVTLYVFPTSPPLKVAVAELEVLDGVETVIPASGVQAELAMVSLVFSHVDQSTV